MELTVDRTITLGVAALRELLNDRDDALSARRAKVLDDALYRLRVVDRFEARRDRPPTGPLAPWQARRATQLLDAAQVQGVPLAVLASACRLSMSHFSKAFRATFGTTPKKLVDARRIELAKKRLATTDQTLADLAAELGYADQTHFTLRFTRAVGTSPARWRRSTRDDELGEGAVANGKERAPALRAPPAGREPRDGRRDTGRVLPDQGGGELAGAEGGRALAA